jgi:intein/homing endonuclease
LPSTLDNEFKNYEQRQNRNTYLTNEQQIFIQVFLSKNKYFYLHSNNFFYEYNGKNYFIVKEDDVIHKLLSTISKDQVLLQWKHKTKVNIIKQIKDRSLFNSIPETDTIQNVLNILYPSIFSSKNTAKYFLTIIGDNIFKKNTNFIFLVTTQMKKLLNELDNIAFNSIGYTNTTSNFMTKYHENHSYDNCRLIKINENFSNDVWRDILKKIGLDLLCVAAHYSKRYENSDKFIENKSDEELKAYSYYIKNTNPNNIVLEFCEKYNLTTKIYRNENKNQSGWTSQDLRIYNTVLSRLLEHFCGKLSHNKFVSNEIIFSNKECLLGFMDAYIGGDGCVNTNCKNHSPDISMASVSKELLIDVQQILNILGVYSKISKFKKQEKNNRGSKNIKQLYTLFVRNKQAQILARHLNIKLDYKQENLKKILTRNFKYEYNQSNVILISREILIAIYLFCLLFLIYLFY